MDYNELIGKYEPLVQLYTNKYYKGIMPKEDFSQELRIKVWQRVNDLYCSSLGKLDSFIKGVISLESKKMRSDIKAQNKFEESLYISETAFLDYPTINYQDVEWKSKILNTFTDEEVSIFLEISRKTDSSLPVKYSHIASSLGINIYKFNKSLTSIRNKIRVYIDNQEYF